MNNPSYVGVGLMSGTSHDGVDLACVRFTRASGNNGDNWQYRIIGAETVPYDEEWRARLLGLTGASAEVLAKTQTDYGHYLGMLLRRFILQQEAEVQFACSHGHTIFHQPDKHFTLQIGPGETIISHLNCPLVTDLRTRDVALGGQGAPLVPFGEQQLFAGTGLFINLGGIANLSVFRQHAHGNFAERTWLKPGWQYLAYDVCACNQVLNELARRHNPAAAYDDGGNIARGGSLLPDLLAQLSALNFYTLVPPRSLGREWVLGEVMPMINAHGGTAQNKLHTFTHHVAQQLAQELDRFGLQSGQALVTGGGAHNTFLMELIRAVLAARGITLLPATPQVIDYKEALIFAFLGLCTLLRIPNVLNAATGARQAVVAGSIHLPQGYGQALL
jgi:anhydro-N-acetylmuramic acid kinase